MKPIIVFSAIGMPSDFVVYKSLQGWRNDCQINLITSKKFAPFWKEHADKIIITRVNSRGFPILFTQKILRRSKWLMSAVRRVGQLQAMSSFNSVLMPPHNSRHFYYRKALQGESFDRPVFLVDSRDLIFQVSPKAVAENISNSSGVILFDEGDYSFKDGREQKNGLSLANLNWALELLNHRTEKISGLLNERIINSGCIFGSSGELQKFLKLSEETLLASNYSNISLLDQASTNFVAYCLKFPTTVVRNGKIVLNMCGVIEEKVELRDGLFTYNNQIIPIVHQFDRYGVWEPETSFRFTKRDYRIQAHL